MPSFTGGFFCAKLEDERKYIYKYTKIYKWLNVY